MDPSSFEESADTLSTEVVICNDDTPGDLPSSDPFNDNFGGPCSLDSTFESGMPSSKVDEFLVILKQESGNSCIVAHTPEESSGTSEHDRTTRENENSASSSLFDDLLDFSSPRTSEIDKILQDNITGSKHPPSVDLLFGVGDDLDSCLGQTPEVKAKNPDILDFVNIPPDLPEISSMDITENLIDGCESSTEHSPLASSKEQTPDIVVTISELATDEDAPDGNVLMKEESDDISDKSAKEKVGDNVKQTTGESQENTLENIKEKTDPNQDNTLKDFKDKNMEENKRKSTDEIDEDNTEKIDRELNKEKDIDKESTDSTKENSKDLDFSVLELSGASHLNFDHYKHKRSISQKGSIANRKKPKRATLQPNSEGSIFLDSTEPKPQKNENEDEPQKDLGSGRSRGDNTQGAEEEQSNKETSPSRKLTVGIKIPGLLEGLSKSKVFNKAEKRSPVAEPEDKLEVSVKVSETALEHSKPSSATVPVALTSSSPIIRPKPVVPPRVLPKPTTKTLKETQNFTTAGEGVVRASSFRIKSSAPSLVEQGNFWKSQSTLSRSASVRTTTSANVLEPTNDQKTFNASKSLFSKPELKKTPPLPALKPVNKTPPLPVKPSVAAKPNKVSAGLSTSFNGGKSPLLPTLKSETSIKSTNTAKDETDSIMPQGLEETAETSKIKNHKEQDVIDSSPSKDNKMGSPRINQDKMPFSFAEKKLQAHISQVTPVKSDTGVESKNSDNTETPKNVTVARISSLKKSQHSGFVANPGFKSYTRPELGKSGSIDADDVFDSSSASTDKSSTSVYAQNSSLQLETSDSSSIVNELTQQRKSSISGISSVKSPVTSDKPTASSMPRKGSITGSAYNPIGFRSALSSSDSEQRSRESSFSSAVDNATLAPNTVVSIATPSVESCDNKFGVSGGQKLGEGFQSSANEQKKSIPDKDKSPEKTDKISGNLSGDGFIPIVTPKREDDERKETANATNRDIREQSRSAASTINGSPDFGKDGGRKSSPWNVNLKKVEKKEPLAKPEPSNKKDDSQPFNWRQKLSSKQNIPAPPKDSEKIERDNTPDWVKASIKRRQRLKESGVIQGET